MSNMDNFEENYDIEGGGGPCNRNCPSLRISNSYDKWSVIIIGLILLTGFIMLVLFGFKII
jgi:hypothetical protein